MRRLLVILALVLVPLGGLAQEIRYEGYCDFSLGCAYNPNTAQVVSIDNIQHILGINTTHGVRCDKYFLGLGIGYYHSFQDKENMMPLYAALSYSLKYKNYIELRLGFMYDNLWISKLQSYGALTYGVSLSNHLGIACRGQMYSRPSRFFTADAALVLAYSF